ncbi:MAG: helicase HerA domain-containing protein [Candidatus Micrarchaeia archaeon]
MQRPLGTVISTEESPTTMQYAFVLDEGSPVKKGQFIQTTSEEGIIFGYVSEITRANRYFERAESVAEYERETPISTHFPIKSWEYAIAEVRVLGRMRKLGDKYIQSRVSLPPSPGTKVIEADEGMLKDFVGFVPNGLLFGKLQNHEVEAKIDMTRLLQKHLAILAMSGAGKSHLASVMLEELLDRSKEDGRVAMVIIDIHGEYAGFRQDPTYGKKIRVINGKDVCVPFRRLTSQMISSWVSIPPTGQRELEKVLREMKGEEKNERSLFSVKDLIKRIEEEPMSNTIKSPLLRSIYELRNLRLVSQSKENPDLRKNVSPGEMLVLDLSDLDDMRKKKVIVAYIADRLFRLRSKTQIPPTFLLVEEAHNFAPEFGKSEHNPDKRIIEKIAREGRKFGLALGMVSQRPVNLSTTALSQANTHILLRVTNPNDLKHIEESAEGIDYRMARSITSLNVGEAIMVGEAVRYPVFLEVRDRKSKKVERGKPLHEQAIEYENSSRKSEEEEEEELEAFL